jgi:hypothetical protein
MHTQKPPIMMGGHAYEINMLMEDVHALRIEEAAQ